MRWQALFADLEGQARALETQERDAEVADRTRGELAQVSMLARLHRQVGRSLHLHIRGAGDISGRLERVGADWVLLSAPEETVVVVSAICLAPSLPVESSAAAGISEVRSRTRLTSVVRAIARDRSAVVVALDQGRALHGTPDRVGADWFDLAVHDESTGPRRGSIQSRVTIPFAAIATIRRGKAGWE